MSYVNWAGDLLGQDLSDELEETEVRLEEFVSQRHCYQFLKRPFSFEKETQKRPIFFLEKRPKRDL